MYLLIDPILFACPPLDAPSTVWRSFVDHLVEWQDEMLIQKERFLIAEVCSEALYSTGLHLDVPAFRQIQEAMSRAEIDYISAVDLRHIYHVVLATIPKFEEIYGLKADDVDYLYPELIDVGRKTYIEAAHVKVELGLAERHTAENLRLAFRLMLGIVAYFHTTKADHPDLSLVTHPILLQENEENIVEPASGCSIALQISGQEHPYRVELGLFAAPNELGLSEVWRNTGKALAWAIRQMEIDGQWYKDSKLPSIDSTGDFNKSLVDQHLENRFDELGRIFREIARRLRPYSTQSIIETNHVHHIMSGNDQVSGGKEGEWGAWRAHIIGYRLHFWWRKSDNHFRLSRLVVGHADMGIGSTELEGGPSIRQETNEPKSKIPGAV